jgi:hypothetical protein
MLLVTPAWACDDAVLNQIAPPAVVTAEPAVGSGSARRDGVSYAGARVSYRSAHPLAEWAPVLARPEDADEWQPPAIGTARVERLDARTIFQQMDISILFGAVHIRRQVVVAVDWIERSATHLHNCWSAIPHEPWGSRVEAWVTDAPFQEHSYGGWEVHPLPDGGTFVSYEFWADTGALPPSVQSWAMSRTLPDLMRAFEGYVGSPAARRGG